MGHTQERATHNTHTAHKHHTNSTHSTHAHLAHTTHTAHAYHTQHTDGTRTAHTHSTHSAHTTRTQRRHVRHTQHTHRVTQHRHTAAQTHTHTFFGQTLTPRTAQSSVERNKAHQQASVHVPFEIKGRVQNTFKISSQTGETELERTCARHIRSDLMQGPNPHPHLLLPSSLRVLHQSCAHQASDARGEILRLIVVNQRGAFNIPSLGTHSRISVPLYHHQQRPHLLTSPRPPCL